MTCNQAEPIFKDSNRFKELADPRLKEEIPAKSLSQAINVAAMCLRDDASMRPFISDVVTALSFLWVGPDSGSSLPPITSYPSLEARKERDAKEVSAIERQRAVAEAIEWVSKSKQQQNNSATSIGSSV